MSVGDWRLCVWLAMASVCVGGGGICVCGCRWLLSVWVSVTSVFGGGVSMCGWQWRLCLCVSVASLCVNVGGVFFGVAGGGVCMLR